MENDPLRSFGALQALANQVLNVDHEYGTEGTQEQRERYLSVKSYKTASEYMVRTHEFMISWLISFVMITRSLVT